MVVIGGPLNPTSAKADITVCIRIAWRGAGAVDCVTTIEFGGGQVGTPHKEYRRRHIAIGDQIDDVLLLLVGDGG